MRRIIGVVTLVNAEEKDGALVESNCRTGIWAWKKPLPEGGYELIRQHGDVRMKDVDFSYVDGKPVLHVLLCRPSRDRR